MFLCSVEGIPSVVKFKNKCIAGKKLELDLHIMRGGIVNNLDFMTIFFAKDFLVPKYFVSL